MEFFGICFFRVMGVQWGERPPPGQGRGGCERCSLVHPPLSKGVLRALPSELLKE